jgi:hypothetical protein
MVTYLLTYLSYENPSILSVILRRALFSLIMVWQNFIGAAKIPSLPPKKPALYQEF